MGVQIRGPSGCGSQIQSQKQVGFTDLDCWSYLLSVHTAAEGAFPSGPRVRVLVVAAEINRRLPRLWYAEARRNVGECVKAWVYVAVKLIMVLSVGG